MIIFSLPCDILSSFCSEKSFYLCCLISPLSWFAQSIVASVVAAIILVNFKDKEIETTIGESFRKESDTFETVIVKPERDDVGST